jgi:hypothetical protein
VTDLARRPTGLTDDELAGAIRYGARIRTWFQAKRWPTEGLKGERINLKAQHPNHDKTRLCPAEWCKS